MDLKVIYITIMPVILGGIGNMLFTKSQTYKLNSSPIDKGRSLGDGEPIFGPNKTWIGFAGMIVITGIMQILWGWICKESGLEALNQIYVVWENTFTYNLLVGFLLGLVYVLFELPNSFIKRRLKIKPGKTDKGLKGIIFFLVDQVDSIIGCGVVIGVVARLPFSEACIYILLGGLTHIVVNLVLFALKIRKNV